MSRLEGIYVTYIDADTLALEIADEVWPLVRLGDIDAAGRVLRGYCAEYARLARR